MHQINKFLFFVFIFVSLLLVSTPIQTFASNTEPKDAVYFASRFCPACERLENSGVLQQLKNEGFIIVTYYLEDNTDYLSLINDFHFTYRVPPEAQLIPIVFAGDTFFIGVTDITNAVTSGTIQDIMRTQDLLELMPAPNQNFSLVKFVLLGLVDGINPCAIATLLMFISLLNFTKKKRVLILVSLTFISAIFISYFLFGTILFKYLGSFPAGSVLVKTVPWVIVGIASLLFILNFYDFVVAYLQKYNKIKNQLPGKIQKFNRRLISYFTKKMDEGGVKIYLTTFIIGVVISFTEFLCTGQAYFTAILHLIHSTPDFLQGMLLLLLYNLIFVTPLIIISVLAITSKSVVSLSNFFRENLYLIKLFNALVFLVILIYYLIVLL